MNMSKLESYTMAKMAMRASGDYSGITNKMDSKVHYFAPASTFKRRKVQSQGRVSRAQGIQAREYSV